MGIIGTILIGFVAGLIARALMPGPNPMGFILTVILGIAGAVVANVLGRALNWYGDGESAGLIASVIGALLVLFAYGVVARKRIET